MYINFTTLVVISLAQLRAAYPHISFPATGPDDETLARLGYARIIPTAPPTVTETQRYSEGPPAQGEDGPWRQTWVVEDLPADAVAAMLDAARTAACARIDAAAEEMCNSVVTPGSAQMARYTRKQAQAEAFLADPVPTADKFPAVYNEVGITAETPQAVAGAILARAAAWWTYGDAVERARLAGKRAALAATSVAGIAAAEAGVEWPST